MSDGWDSLPCWERNMFLTWKCLGDSSGTGSRRGVTTRTTGRTGRDTERGKGSGPDLVAFKSS